ncbi:MAG: hypothetical protein DWQ44_09265 [Bacteroidetes bacterium]|nr:MAG: hypothetical protein DWQ33_02510 [Bacteroidota bacterium]REK06476.1 MAG: hypothetical protein DWQ39_03055 [Bacteroidota bacterium]REK33242.1 MAG: hypothetical protein DWQ44_09265 [Bacteroidota bacterium]REK47079.1 MAG: hypothetical protein DWQ48_13600 [Bacteroidota bacterium]
MEVTTETKKVLIESQIALESLLKVTNDALLELEKIRPNDVETRVRYKEVERSAKGMRKQINELLQNM